MPSAHPRTSTATLNFTGSLLSNGSNGYARLRHSFTSSKVKQILVLGIDINVELASPDQFIPAVPGWRERSLSIARHGQIEFFHYDPYGQTLSKLQRRHDRDIQDARSFLRDGLIDVARLLEMFEQIEPELIRYPAVDAASFRSAVLEFCDENK